MFHSLVCIAFLVGLVRCTTILEDPTGIKPRLEKNKINKGVWLRDKKRDSFERPVQGEFIFRANSLDAESVQNAFDPFYSKQDAMLASDGYVGRDKRSPHSKSKHRFRKSLNNKTKLNTKASTVFNDYPYEVAVLHDSPNNKNIDYNVYPKYDIKVPKVGDSNDSDSKKISELNLIASKDKKKHFVKKDEVKFEHISHKVNTTEGNVSVPKRSMNYGLEIDRISFLEVLNKSKDQSNPTKMVKDEKVQSAPARDVAYEIVPNEHKVEVEMPKPVSERGLIKVLSMLTKTFRKIMKQHSDIKTMHDEMINVDEEFTKRMEESKKKLEDFDAKYLLFLKMVEKMKTVQEKMKAKEESYKKKEEQMSKNLIQFESQQKKFLAQQQQFYNIQKLMLAQNEKINQRQNTIAKTQNEISHRQNNFARVLKKAKQLYIDTKYLKMNTTIAAPKEVYEYKEKETHTNVTKEKKVEDTTSRATTESIKINLFSIPASNPIENQDQMILKEKDEKPVDDLIYKYYFNNTFIDTIMKNKILSGIFIGDKVAIARNAKQKRNKHRANHMGKLNITLMIPVYNETKPVTLNRERRWINHHSRRKHRRKQRGKTLPSRQSLYLDEDKTQNNEATELPKETVAIDPFVAMATSFCNGIGQNSTKQILDWCVEKALRRLKSLEMKLVPPPPQLPKQDVTQLTVVESSYNPTEVVTEKNTTTTTVTEAPVVTKSTLPVILTTDLLITQNKPTESKNDVMAAFNAFFPDNDELELNLKQFDLTRDTVGNFYYDGSLHESDIPLKDQSDPVSDFLPEFDSNSRIDIDTRAIELQAKRRYSARRMKNMLQKKRGSGKRTETKTEQYESLFKY